MSVHVVTYERRGDIVVLTMNRPPVNALGYVLRSGLAKAFERALADTAVDHRNAACFLCRSRCL